MKPLNVVVFAKQNTNCQRMVSKLVSAGTRTLQPNQVEVLDPIHQLRYTIAFSPYGDSPFSSLMLIRLPSPERRLSDIPSTILQKTDCIIYCLDLSQTIDVELLVTQFTAIRNRPLQSTMKILIVGVNVEFAPQERLRGLETATAALGDLVSGKFLSTYSPESDLASMDNTADLVKELLKFARQRHFDYAKKILFESLKKHRIPDATLQELEPIVNNFLLSASRGPIDVLRIEIFKDDCRHLFIRNAPSFPTPSALNAIQCFLSNFIWIALLATLLGFTAGFVFGVWAGPAAFIMTALQLNSAAGIVLTGASTLATLDAGHRVLGLFDPVSLAKNDISLFAENIQDHHKNCI